MKFILNFFNRTLYYTILRKKSILFCKTEGKFTDFRTDLALERHEMLNESEMSGIKTEISETGNMKITKITVATRDASLKIGRPEGTYITAEIPPLSEYCAEETETVEALARLIVSLLPEEGTVLTVGLGNESITPDALGPVSCSMILATRHISGELSEDTGLGRLRPSAVFAPGVLGQTGVETAEMIKGITRLISPCAVIVIDALAAGRLSRLGRTVQISDSGIIPGSGVGNSRAEISRRTLGVPVISIGVPTVADVRAVVSDISDDESGNMIVTSREIDVVISRAARLTALAVNKALQPHISVEEMLILVASV